MTENEELMLAREAQENLHQCVGMMRAAASIIQSAGPRNRALFEVWYASLTATQKAVSAMWRMADGLPLLETHIDWKALLVKYACHVEAAEGYQGLDFAPCGMPGMEFTEADREAFREIAAAVKRWNESLSDRGGA